MIQYLLALIFICCMVFSTNAQTDNSFLIMESESLDSVNNGDLTFEFFNSNVCINKEYFNKIANGYTLFGTQNVANIDFQPNEHISFKLGGYFRKDFGNDGFTKVAPYYLLTLQNNGYTLNFGNIHGNLGHRLIEPMYLHERYFTHFLENGIQFKIEKEHIWHDTWINWEKQQCLYSDYLESLFVGSNTYWNAVDNSNYSITLPLQITGLHNGGQLDTITDPQFTIINTAIGMQLGYNGQKLCSSLDQIQLNMYYLQHKDITKSQVFHYNSGHALYLNSQLVFKGGFYAALSYWNGHSFIHPRGEYLFQSISSHPFHYGYHQQRRQLILADFAYRKRLFNEVNLDFRIAPYFDLNNQFLEYSISLYLIYQPSFLIKKITKNGNNG